MVSINKNVKKIVSGFMARNFAISVKEELSI